MPEGRTVAELCEAVDAAVAGAFPDEVWVKGAISGLSRSANGHVYFDLVDPGDLGGQPQAILSVALFAKAKFRVNAILRKSGAIRMVDGIEIQVRGRVAYYPRQGRVQLIMSLIDPSFTLGRLEQARAELLAELSEGGLLEANGSLPFPVVPLRVALVTSSGSAAEADFVTGLAASGLRFEVTLYDSRVQGAEAVEDLVSAIGAAGTTEAGRPRHDVIAVVRGGGARTDLVAFDHRAVALAIARSPLPIVVGIGHETDRSVADEVAARSVKTPTACAALLVDAVEDFSRRVDVYAERIVRATDHRLQRAATAIDRAELHLAQRVERRVLTEQHRTDQASRRVVAAVERRLDQEMANLELAALAVRSADPRRILERGFAVVHDADGRLVRSVAQLAVGTRIELTLADGTLRAHTDPEDEAR